MLECGVTCTPHLVHRVVRSWTVRAAEVGLAKDFRPQGPVV